MIRAKKLVLQRETVRNLQGAATRGLQTPRMRDIEGGITPSIIIVSLGTLFLGGCGGEEKKEPVLSEDIKCDTVSCTNPPVCIFVSDNPADCQRK